MWKIENAIPEGLRNDSQKVKQLSNGVVEKGCIYQKDGIFEPSKTGLMVANMSQIEQKFRQNQLGILGQWFNSYCLSLLRESKETAKWLGITPEEVDLAFSTKLPEQPMVSYFGVDVCGTKGVINDLNVDRATIVGFQPEFVEVFGKEFPWLLPNMVSFYDRLIKEFKVTSGKDNPRVFVLTAEDEHYVKPFETFSNRFRYKFGSIQNLEDIGYDFDLVFRCIKSEVILKDPVRYKNLFYKLTGGLPMINPLGSYLLGNKGWEVLLGVNKPLGCDTSGWFPEPVILYSGINGIAIDSTGKLWNKEELVSKLLGKVGDVSNKNGLVAKKAFSFGGYDVSIGKKVKAWEWQKLVNEMGGSKLSWVFETCQERQDTVVSIGEWDGLDQEIKSSIKTLNLVQRLYACGQFPDEFALTGEVFGGESLKVNASGYTFPIVFSKNGEVV